MIRPEVNLDDEVRPYIPDEIIPIDDDFSSSKPGSSIHFSFHKKDSHIMDNDDGI
jgi:hypothetical protein